MSRADRAVRVLLPPRQLADPMILQAAGLAGTGVPLPHRAALVAALYLGSARPRSVAGFYLIGATVMSLVMGLVLVVALRAANLSRPSAHATRYDFRARASASPSSCSGSGWRGAIGGAFF